jgi:Ring finger domain
MQRMVPFLGVIAYFGGTLVPFLFLIALGFCILHCRQRRLLLHEQPEATDHQDLDNDSWFTNNNNNNNNSNSNTRVKLDQKEQSTVNLLSLPKVVYHLHIHCDPCSSIGQKSGNIMTETQSDIISKETSIYVETVVKNVEQIHQCDESVVLAVNGSTINETTISKKFMKFDDRKQLCESCCVCLEMFKDLEVVTVLPTCMHTFHPKCIGLWIVEQSKNECPLCKQTIFDKCHV